MPIDTAQVIQSDVISENARFVARTIVEIVASGASSYTIAAGTNGAVDGAGNVPDFSNLPIGTTAANTTLGSVIFSVSALTASSHIDIINKGTSDETILSLSGTDDWNFVPLDGGSLGLPNGAAGASGDVFINPVGFGPDDSYSVILEYLY